jgi:hypothetical protein
MVSQILLSIVVITATIFPLIGYAALRRMSGSAACGCSTIKGLLALVTFALMAAGELHPDQNMGGLVLAWIVWMPLLITSILASVIPSTKDDDGEKAQVADQPTEAVEELDIVLHDTAPDSGAGDAEDAPGPVILEPADSLAVDAPADVDAAAPVGVQEASQPAAPDPPVTVDAPADVELAAPLEVDDAAQPKVTDRHVPENGVCAECGTVLGSIGAREVTINGRLYLRCELCGEHYLAE